MNLFKINTTAYNEEDFLLLTNLSSTEIVEVIRPIVDKERNSSEGKFAYTNDDLVNALHQSYEDATILHFYEDAVEIISI